MRRGRSPTRHAPARAPAAVLAALAMLLGGCGGGTQPGRSASDLRQSLTALAHAPASGTVTDGAPAPVSRRSSAFAVGVQVLHLLDRSRTITLPGGAVRPRPLTTIVRYPAAGAQGGAGASAARGEGPFPLIVFGHGFAVTPAVYGRLLDHWTRAGFVVAAPVFPLGNRNAPGGPYEPDLVNQPADMSFVVSSLLAAARAGSGPLAGILDPRRIALAGQSDGGDSALAAAFDPRHRDRRIRAAVILSGAAIPYEGGFSFPSAGPALLAVQGTADTINPPQLTRSFFAAAHSPKFLLSLQGAGHLPPYTASGPQLAVVERVTTAFLEHYLAWRPVSLRRLAALAGIPGVASLQAG